MMKLTYKGKTLELNKDLTISQWQKLKSNEKLYTEDRAALLSLYLNMDIDEVKKLPKGNIQLVETVIRKDILNVKEPEELIQTIEFNGVTYGLENDWNNLAWGAWADMEILSAEEIDKKIHHLMAILFRPVVSQKGKKYKIVDYDPKDVLERAELFRELPVKYWWWVSGFFFRVAKLYTTGIKNSLKWRIVKMTLKLKLMKMLPKYLQRKLFPGFTLH